MSVAVDTGAEQSGNGCAYVLVVIGKFTSTGIGIVTGTDNASKIRRSGRALAAADAAGYADLFHGLSYVYFGDSVHRDYPHIGINAPEIALWSE